jgi:glycosyltransferase involved in cell wall biosynthesis
MLEEAMARGVACEVLRARHPWDPRQIGRLVRIVRRTGAHALVTHGYKADIIGLAAARATRTRVVAYVHGWTGEDTRVRRHERVDRLVLRYMDAVVAVSEATRRALVGIGISPARVVTIPNAVATDETPPYREAARRRLAEIYQLRASSTIIATAGRLSPEKAQGDFLRACSRLKDGGHNPRFLIFGDGQERSRLGELAGELALRERVVFCGYRADFLDLLPGVDLLVLSSHAEQLPFVILEAFAAMVPVVATDVGGVSELAEHETTALLVPPGSPELLAAAMGDALRNPGAAARRAEAARRLVDEHYGSAANAQRFAELIKRLVLDSRKGSIL